MQRPPPPTPAPSRQSACKNNSHSPVGSPGAGGELRPAAALRGDDPRPVRFGDRDGVVARAAIDDDNLANRFGDPAPLRSRVGLSAAFNVGMITDKLESS